MRMSQQHKMQKVRTLTIIFGKHGSCSVVHKPHDTILQKASLIGEDAVKLQNSSQAASAQ